MLTGIVSTVYSPTLTLHTISVDEHTVPVRSALIAMCESRGYPDDLYLAARLLGELLNEYWGDANRTHNAIICDLNDSQAAAIREAAIWGDAAVARYTRDHADELAGCDATETEILSGALNYAVESPAPQPQPDHCPHGNPEHDYCPICDDDPSQTWIIRTSERLDNDDNDTIGFQVDEETYPHALPLDVDDWKHAAEEVVDVERDAQGNLTRLILESFDQDYDRSAEVWFPILRTRDIERQEVTA